MGKHPHHIESILPFNECFLLCSGSAAWQTLLECHLLALELGPVASLVGHCGFPMCTAGWYGGHFYHKDQGIVCHQLLPLSPVFLCRRNLATGEFQ